MTSGHVTGQPPTGLCPICTNWARDQTDWVAPHHRDCPDDWKNRAMLAEASLAELLTPRPLADWHEDDGPALWWTLPMCEAPYSGSPLDSDWPDCHTHWTPIPQIVEPKETP